MSPEIAITVPLVIPSGAVSPPPGGINTAQLGEAGPAACAAFGVAGGGETVDGAAVDVGPRPLVVTVLEDDVDDSEGIVIPGGNVTPGGNVRVVL